jgi:uncharacterized repeat protein (TIGR03803 family)
MSLSTEVTIVHWSNRFVFVVGLAVMAATSSFALLPARASGATYTILHSFADGSVTNDGQKPYAAPIQATDGDFYGTTATGGSAGKGTVYRITSTGLVTVLHSFGDGSVTDDGAYPEAELIQATDGNLYGTTSAGGAAGDGTVFEITTSGAITLLHSFGDTAVTNDGIYPEAPLIQASDGNFYSTTANGGSANDGSIFKITKSGVVTILHSFGDGSVTNDGTDPYGALIQATDGSFYSTTANGGSTGTTTPLSGCGTVFRMTAAGSVTILHSFRDGSVTNDGDGPYAGLIQASDGSFYGTTYYGGSTDTGKPSTGSGTVFRITTTGTLTIVHSFGDGSVVDDGANPLSPVIQGRDGSIYGTTNLGGSPTLNAGTVFKITPAGA